MEDSTQQTIFNSSIQICEKMREDETHNYTHKHVVASFFQWSNNIQHIATHAHDPIHTMVSLSKKQSVVWGL
jgi:hypothetical protein